MVFCRTKRAASKLADDLISRGFAAAPVHGDLGQGAREQALRAFRSGKIDVLVATDVAARGIDVADVTHVINYECPDDEKTYVHRVGRTGRAGNSGVAITLVDWPDMARWQMINRALGLAFNDPIETYSSSDHVYTGLGISKEVNGALPHAQQTRVGLESENIEDLGETGANKGRRSQTAQKSGSRQSGSGSRPSGSSSRQGGRSERSSAPRATQGETVKKEPRTEPRAPRNRTRSRSNPSDS